MACRESDSSLNAGLNFNVLFIEVPYYCGDPTWEPDLEN